MSEAAQVPGDPLKDEIRQLADDIFREKVLRARRMPSDKRIELGPQLFDWAVKSTLSGIRAQHPQADEQDVFRILLQRMAIKRRLDEAGVYVTVEEAT